MGRYSERKEILNNNTKNNDIYEIRLNMGVNCTTDESFKLRWLLVE